MVCVVEVVHNERTFTFTVHTLTFAGVEAIDGALAWGGIVVAPSSVVLASFVRP